MKKITLCFVFSAAMAALTSCGKIEKEPTPDRIVHKLTTTSTTVTSSTDHALTTTVSADSIKVKKMSFAMPDEADEAAVPDPVETTSANDETAGDTSKSGDSSSKFGGNNAGMTTQTTTTESNSENTTTTTAEKISEEFGEISGEWIYQKRIADNQYINNGYVNIADDGTFEFYISETQRTVSGCIEKYAERHYSFMKNNTDIFINGKFKANEPGVFYFGDNNTARMIKSDDLSDNIDFNILTGEWEYQEIDRSTGEYTTVGRMNVESGGTYTYYPGDDNNGESGSITLQNEEYPDGTEKLFFAFCDDGNIDNVWKSCLCEQYDPDIFYAGNGGESRFVRTQATAPPDDYELIAYDWVYSEYDTESDQYLIAGYMTIEENGHYSYTSVNGGEDRYGVIKTEIDEFGNDKIVFYDYGRDFRMSAEFYHQRTSVLAIYNDGSDLNGNTYKGFLDYNGPEITAGDHFLGQWEENTGYTCRGMKAVDRYNMYVFCDNCIDSENHIYASEEWIYDCIYDETMDSLVCNGKGIHNQKKFYEDDEIFEVLDEVYLGTCSAVFRFENKNLVWENTDTGEIMVLPPHKDMYT